MKNSPVIIVGSGLSGMMAALRLAESQIPVTLISMQPPLGSATVTSHAGINAALPQNDWGDTPEKHVEETLALGQERGNRLLVQEMTEYAPVLLQFLQRLGIPFEKTVEGSLYPRPEGGTKTYRSYFAGGMTGQRVVEALARQIFFYEEKGLIERFVSWEFLSLIRNDRGVGVGVMAYHLPTMEIRPFLGNGVIVATGGFSSLWPLSPGCIHNDGVALARMFQDGVALTNLDTFQYQLGALPLAKKSLGITPALLSEGARFFILKDKKPWYFLEERAPRTKNRTSFREAIHFYHHICEEYGTRLSGLFVDVTHRPSDRLQKSLADLLKTIQKLTSINPIEQVISVQPLVSETLGGVWTDEHLQTTIPGVLACGSALGVLHGTAALESNLMLGSLYTGLKAANETLLSLSQRRKMVLPTQQQLDIWVKKEHRYLHQLLEQKGKERPFAFLDELRSFVSVYSESEILLEGFSKLNLLKEKLKNISLTDKSLAFNEELLLARRLPDLILLVENMLLSRQHRRQTTSPDQSIRLIWEKVSQKSDHVIAAENS